MRRAFLCGDDHLTGKSYEHRKQWIVERLEQLAQVFAIEICAYAVMSNHYHLVVRIDRARAEQWSEAQVMRRWGKLFNLPLLIERYRKGLTTTEAEARQARKDIAVWRERLSDLSWYMRTLNEHLARRANAEDGCTGRFWEGRYKSQALLDEAAVLTCMSYVDFNPIRAGLADSPEASDYTSIQQRIRDWANRQPRKPVARDSQPPAQAPLMALSGRGKDPHPNAIHFTLQDYLELVDWAGRAIRRDKRGYIPEHLPPILERLGIEPAAYLRHVKGQSTQPVPNFLGHVHRIKAAADQLGQRFIKGLYLAKALYPPPSS